MKKIQKLTSIFSITFYSFHPYLFIVDKEFLDDFMNFKTTWDREVMLFIHLL